MSIYNYLKKSNTNFMSHAICEDCNLALAVFPRLLQWICIWIAGDTGGGVAYGLEFCYDNGILDRRGIHNGDNPAAEKGTFF